MSKQNKHSVLRDLAVYVYTDLRYLTKYPNEGLLKDLRYFPQWLRYRKGKAVASTMQEQSPWLVFDAIEFLKSFLKKDMKVFEYGSGGSTLFFAQRVKEIVSVEHDAFWFGEVTKIILDNGIKNIDYKLREPDNYPQFDLGKRSDPGEFISYYHGFEGKQFKSYAQAIDTYADQSFDLVVVDGRARISCIRQALPKIKKGGFLLVDNADRPAYLLPFDELNDGAKWERNCYTGHFPMCPASVLDRTIFFKKLF